LAVFSPYLQNGLDYGVQTLHADRYHGWANGVSMIL